MIDYRTLAPFAPDGPLRLPEFVPGVGAVEVDIGFGRGLSIFERADQDPERRLLGIEVKPKYAYRVEQRCLALGHQRVRICCGDARDILGRLQPDASVDRVSLHFPDPWWKKRHAKRRLFDADLLGDLARLLAIDGVLWIQTDVEERAREHIEQIAAHSTFELLGDHGLVAENPFGVRSNREKRAVEDGLPVWRILARRRGPAFASA